MNMNGILERISLRSAEIGTNDTALSKHAGSRDLIRNWRRSLAKDQPINAKMVSIEAIATALDVPLQWLIDGTGYDQKAYGPKAARGFSESTAAKWTPKQDDDAFNLAMHLAPGIKHPQFFRMTQAALFLGLLEGDILVVEANDHAKHGDIVIANTYDEAGEASATLVRRWLPPYLFSCDPTDPEPTIIIDFSGRATILGTVEASYRPASAL